MQYLSWQLWLNIKWHANSLLIRWVQSFRCRWLLFDAGFYSALLWLCLRNLSRTAESFNPIQWSHNHHIAVFLFPRLFLLDQNQIPDFLQLTWCIFLTISAFLWQYFSSHQHFVLSNISDMVLCIVVRKRKPVQHLVFSWDLAGKLAFVHYLDWVLARCC